MKNRIIIFCLLGFMVACNSQDSGTTASENVLLGEGATIWFVTNFEESTSPPEWTSGLDMNKLMEITFKAVLNEEIDVYSPNKPYFTYEKVPVDEIKNRLDWTNGVPNYNNLNLNRSFCICLIIFEKLTN